MTTIANLKQQLEELGLEGNKALVYIACLELGKATVLDIAKQAELKRTTVYDNIDYLLKHGLISERHEEKKRFFTPTSPKRILELLKDKEQLFKQVSPELFSLYNNLEDKPGIQYFYGKQGLLEAKYDIFNHKECKEVYYWLNVKKHFEILEQEPESFSETYVEQRKKNNIFAYGIWEYDENYLDYYTPEKNKQELRDIRLAPAELRLNAYIQLYNNRVLIMSTKGEVYALIVESKELYTTLKSLWDLAWSVSRQYK